MSRTSAVFGRRTLELSNLEKVLFPADGIIKAELIEYYVKVAPTLLGHIKGRPLSLVRYPDGIEGEAFFQKNRPKWTPEWLEHVALGSKEKTDYILATEEASIVWIANLAAIELHQMHCRAPQFDRPDYMVFDLDPPEGYPFARVVELALELREQLEALEYHPFVKTTGGKGVHVVVPLVAEAGFDRVFDTALGIARRFVASREAAATLEIKKAARRGRVLIDVYRNHTTQTIVAPYSVRGWSGAPVSMPLAWEALGALADPASFNLRTAADHLVREGDAWEAIGAYAVRLHTERKHGKPGGRRPAPESLDLYGSKRRFERTPEPPPAPAAGEGDAFVVHRHHASRLHYDLRLEKGGVLRCWAVPKGLPPRPGIKRLAVATEDHPLEYLRFEGTIPKGEYGGGPMWIYIQGRYEVTKQKKDGGFYFRLQGPGHDAEYRIHHTRERDWLLERVSNPQIEWLREPIEPMLAEGRTEPPRSGDYVYEVKWDGIRAMVTLDEGELRIRSRSQRDITRLFPELLVPEEAFRASCGLFDCEIVCLDEAGKPVFEDVIRRLQHATEGAVARARARHPAVCYVFDCLYLDGRAIAAEPLSRRRQWLADSFRPNPVFRVSEAVTEGAELFQAASKLGLEGVMAKESGSPYLPGRRSAYWLKIKARQTAECVVVGYTRGKGERERRFGALQLARYRGSKLRYVGKVGTGFDGALMRSIWAELAKLEARKRPVEEKPLDDAATVWLEPKLVCEVRYASITSQATLREPVFLRLRPDLVPEDCKG